VLGVCDHYVSTGACIHVIIGIFVQVKNNVSMSRVELKLSEPKVQDYIRAQAALRVAGQKGVSVPKPGSAAYVRPTVTKPEVARPKMGLSECVLVTHTPRDVRVSFVVPPKWRKTVDANGKVG